MEVEEEVRASGHRGAPREARGRLGAKLVQQLGQFDDAGAVRVEHMERRGNVLIGQVVHAELLERVAELLRVQKCTPRCGMLAPGPMLRTTVRRTLASIFPERSLSWSRKTVRVEAEERWPRNVRTDCTMSTPTDTGLLTTAPAAFAPGRRAVGSGRWVGQGPSLLLKPLWPVDSCTPWLEVRVRVRVRVRVSAGSKVVEWLRRGITAARMIVLGAVVG